MSGGRDIHPISVRVLQQIEDRLQEAHSGITIELTSIAGTFRGWVAQFAVISEAGTKVERLAYIELDHTLTVRVKHDIILGDR